MTVIKVDRYIGATEDKKRMMRLKRENSMRNIGLKKMRHPSIIPNKMNLMYL
ncbi:MAG: hypothetical protein HYS98_04110 [Deltaproteobacteria bacterium]|nr:hypothetical protein [Deltaproteobacteria bacterium]